MSNYHNIIQIIEENFNPIIGQDTNRLSLNIYTESNIHVSFYCDANETSFSIDIDTYIIIIHHLAKCDLLKGGVILSTIIKIAKGIVAKTKAKYVELQLIDSSKIFFDYTNCSIDLAHLYILLHGISWYNNFGFISEDSLLNKQKNDNLRNKQLLELFEIFRDSEIKKHIEFIYRIDELKDRFNSITISEYVKYIHNLVKNIQDNEEEVNICDSDEFKLLEDIIVRSSKFINYNRELYMIVNTSPKIITGDSIMTV